MAFGMGIECFTRRETRLFTFHDSVSPNDMPSGARFHRDEKPCLKWNGCLTLGCFQFNNRNSSFSILVFCFNDILLL